MLWKSGLLPVTKRLLSLLFVLCLVTLTAVRSEESSSATADATDAATTTTASTTTTEQEKQHSSDCVILPDGTMECPPAAQDDAEPPSQQPEDRIDEDGSDESDLEDGEEDDDEDEDGEPAPIPTDGDLEDCTDQNETCEYWASIGECEGNPAYMLLNCPHSCQSCSMDSVVNNGHTRQYGKRQSGSDAGTLERIESMHKYMTEQVFVNASFAKVKAEVRYMCVFVHMYVCHEKGDTPLYCTMPVVAELAAYTLYSVLTLF
jgi:ShK domain-like